MPTELVGKTIRWSYADGPMKGKGFEHRFADDGTVTWKGAGDETPSPDSRAKYEFARIFPGTVVETELFCPVAPPPGPVVERYSGVAWPGGRFDSV